jgi:hypothetical protein
LLEKTTSSDSSAIGEMVARIRVHVHREALSRGDLIDEFPVTASEIEHRVRGLDPAGEELPC